MCFSVNVLLEVFSKNFLIFFWEISHRKGQFKYKIAEMRITLYAFFVDQLDRVSNKNGDNRRSFVEEGPPPTCAEVQQQQQYAHAYLETGSVWPMLSRTERLPFAPVVRLKDVCCRLK